MGLVRIANPNELRAGHIVLLGLIALALLGTFLLTSAGRPAVVPDGAVEWDPDSLLLALVEILDLQYAQPTPNGVAVKSLVFGAASGLALLVVAIGLAAWARSEREALTGDDVIDIEQPTPNENASLSAAKKQLNPIRTAQVLMLLYVAWSLASTLWSNAPEYAFGGAVLLAGQTAWAFSLGFGLNRRAAVLAAYLLVGALLFSAVMAIAYHAQRNPTLRASYPIGNPLFLASCLLPGFVIGCAMFVGGGINAKHGRVQRGVLQLVLGIVVIGVLGYATWLTRSRGPAIGLGLALAAMVFFASGRRLRIAIATVTMIGIVVLGGFLFSQRFADSATGRGASMRLRLFSWPYAIDLFMQQPLIGGGEGYYSLAADTLAVADVTDDPAPLEQRISHAHCEWLEVAANLGTVGFVLVVVPLALTLLGGARALRSMRVRAHRVMMIALLSSLVGLIVAECFGVALRFETTPLVYFTVIGLIWALASPTPAALLSVLGKHRAARMFLVVAALAIGGLIAESARRDFSGARAAYDVGRVFESGEFEQADKLARRAYHNRLAPHRKLMGHRLLVDVKLRTAIYLQGQYRRRATLAESSGVTDSRLRAEAETSRKACERKIAEGEAELANLVSIAPTVFNAGGMAYGFRQLRAFFAGMDNDADAIAAHQQAAAIAQQGEILRRPFSAELAAEYVLIGFEEIEPKEAFVILARPLRLERPSSGYIAVLDRMLTAAGGYDQFIAGFDALAAHPVADETENWPDRWAPELLRLAAIVAYAKPDYDRAARYLERATHYYEKLSAAAPLARAACHAEMADAIFFQQPLAPEPAIQAAERALELAPNSEDGRLLSRQLAQRLLTFHLAAGHEDFARKIADKWTSLSDKADVDELIAERLVDLAYSVFNFVWRTDAERLTAWSDRALELAPKSAACWFLAGDIAVHQRDQERVAECVRATLDHGGDPEDAVGLLERALQSMPNSNRLQLVLQTLRKAMLPENGNLPPDLRQPNSTPPVPVTTNGL